MNSPLNHIRNGAIFLALIFGMAVMGFHFLGHRDWIESFYMVIITISTVGFGEETDLDWKMQLLTIAVIVFGMSATAYTMGGLFQMLTEGEVERALGHRRMTRGIERLKGHIIICGYGRMGQILAEELKRKKHPFVILDNDSERIVEAELRGYLVVTGDATDEEFLQAAGLEHAKTLVAGLPNDAANVFITLTARNLNQDLQILARANEQTTHRKLIQAGADQIVLPAAIGAQRLAMIITHPTSADLLELINDRSILDVDIDEVTIPNDSQIIGTVLRDAEAFRRLHLLIIAVKRKDGKMLFNPDADSTLHMDDTLIIMGRIEDIDQFRGEIKG